MGVVTEARAKHPGVLARMAVADSQRLLGRDGCRPWSLAKGRILALATGLLIVGVALPRSVKKLKLGVVGERANALKRR
jgi:hypothetical protein